MRKGSALYFQSMPPILIEISKGSPCLGTCCRTEWKVWACPTPPHSWDETEEQNPKERNIIMGKSSHVPVTIDNIFFLFSICQKITLRKHFEGGSPSYPFIIITRDDQNSAAEDSSAGNTLVRRMPRMGRTRPMLISFNLSSNPGPDMHLCSHSPSHLNSPPSSTLLGPLFPVYCLSCLPRTYQKVKGSSSARPLLIIIRILFDTPALYTLRRG